jgi:myo-inositol-1(or 4)-monophosphatase
MAQDRPGTSWSATERARACDVALEAAREAGELLLGYLGRLDPAGIGHKSAARDLVTEADLASERCLVERLRRAFPGHAIEAEEAVHDARSSRPRWFLDPLDGTVNFVHSLPCFSISLGLYVDDQPEVAVVHAPRLSETFHALRGGGAFLDGQRLQVSATGTLADAMLATGFPYRRLEARASNLENFSALLMDVRALRRMGSAALDLAYVAAGRFDGYWELQLSPHDVAAGALLVREAGGLVTDLDGGEDWLRGGHILAAGPAVHALLRPRLVH